MTRAQRIALARFARRTQRVIVPDLAEAFARIDACVLPSQQRCGCYEAMDDIDPYQDVNPSESIVFVRGNAGMRCA